jgi:hypothetical protein
MPDHQRAWAGNCVALVALKQSFDLELDAQAEHFLPEAQDARGLLPLSSALPFLGATGRLVVLLDALTRLDLSSLLADTVGADLLRQVQMVLCGLRCMADPSA